MAHMLTTISTISFAAAIVFVVVSVILWFAFKIPMVAGELSGRTAKKSIQKMRMENENAQTKHYDLKDKKHKSVKQKNLKQKSLKQNHMVENRTDTDKMETELLNENHANESKSNETCLLNENVTKDINETVCLEVEKPNMQPQNPSIKIKMIQEVMYLHTEEEI